MVKRERIDGKLDDQEFMFIKVRHQPFSAYMYFLGPENLKGQEAIYVDGKNNGNLLGHGVGIKKIAGTVPLQADRRDGHAGPALSDHRDRHSEPDQAADRSRRAGQEVRRVRGQVLQGREDQRAARCTCIQVVHPVPRRNFRFHMARVFVDDELNMPVRYEAYEWPSKPGGQPPLIEEYTYIDFKLNNGFTDADFDQNNPSYSF